MRAGFKGGKNGDLLLSAEAAGYDLLLTVDQGIPHQQSGPGRRIAIIAIRSRTNQLEDIIPLTDEILRVLDAIEPGETKSIPPPA